MNDRFIAVDVGTGDAFFLERRDSCALVDGGQASGFPRRLQRATTRDAVNILVCTHNDRDHANGVLEFLEDGCGADECWLPATWLEATSRLLEASDDEFETLFGTAPEELPQETPRDESTEISGNRLAEQLADLAEDPPIYVPGFWFPRRQIVPRRTKQVRGLIHPLLEDAFRIVSIALAASRQQIPIRWFDPEREPLHDASSLLTVLNAREVTHMCRAKLSLPGVLRLTTVNRLSLVLYSPPSERAPGVLFCADSGLANVTSLVADTGMIVTAPHHGATDAENVAAYGLLDQRCTNANPPSWHWVRSDSRNNARPCNEYRARPIRFCTRCRGSSAQNFQNVVFQGDSGAWSSNSQPCHCT